MTYVTRLCGILRALTVRRFPFGGAWGPPSFSGCNYPVNDRFRRTPKPGLAIDPPRQAPERDRPFWENTDEPLTSFSTPFYVPAKSLISMEATPGIEPG